MKKLLLLSTLALSLGAVSCQPKKCWTCTTQQITPRGVVYDVTWTELVCDKTQREIRDHEAKNTFSVGDSVDGYTQTTTCK